MYLKMYDNEIIQIIVLFSQCFAVLHDHVFVLIINLHFGKYLNLKGNRK